MDYITTHKLSQCAPTSLQVIQHPDRPSTVFQHIRLPQSTKEKRQEANKQNKMGRSHVGNGVSDEIKNKKQTLRQREALNIGQQKL
ncbi:hypothetical protein TNIN_378621 [Trichonephila inaurata madagascariensis]|uniref:Uncharacterized protein n=1 Tax=Trichonephila inaurata madagascariensis TaxID=2747483 RepID=A0A8X6YIW1_9ARAC|nr:hypothetical protein TNIN_378621 [Trichonephila inaurata madagascariensis]